MKASIEIRKKLGLTQQELAGLLQVSRSSINLYELGKRGLPVAALIKLGQLEIMYNRVQQEGVSAGWQHKAAVSGHNTGKQVDLLRGKMQACRDKAAGLQKQLEDMQQEFNRLICLVNAMETWQQDMPGRERIEESQLFLEIMQYKIQQKIILAGPEEQFILQHRINILLNEAALHESALDQLQSGTFNSNS